MEIDDMAEPLSDFSKIIELQEIKRLYDDAQESHLAELAERDAEIERLRHRIAIAEPAAPVEDSESARIREENERLSRQVQLVREEYDAKIERLNARIRELSASAGRTPEPVVETERRGFFRR